MAVVSTYWTQSTVFKSIWQSVSSQIILVVKPSIYKIKFLSNIQKLPIIVARGSRKTFISNFGTQYFALDKKNLKNAFFIIYKEFTRVYSNIASGLIRIATINIGRRPINLNFKIF